MLTCVLVANRGEIARRVFRTCRELGLATVAVYSDADARSPHVAEAGAAVRLPGESPASTYLRADLLIEAALRSGADAVHPGYGFLSENAAFARAVQEAGLTWIGPSPAAIEAMGSKIEAKRLMAAAGVPVLGELDPEALTEDDLPVLIKASAGGGGRGLRVVRAVGQLAAGLTAARSEAAAAFGDPPVFCEPSLEPGRHIEVQILADLAGTIWTLGERECSIQRRHQKIIEEAPPPLVQRTPGLRERRFDAARAAAKAVGYVNAGTVEFLADETGQFYFLEMNTRLQVEHPVTECTTGLDLVALQLQIAAGRSLPAVPPQPAGHAIEVRLYAEDPAAGWQPQSGTLHAFQIPGQPAEFGVPDRLHAVRAELIAADAAGAGGTAARRADAPSGGLADVAVTAAAPVLRVDSSVRSGSAIGARSDPMLAKVICWSADRAQAAAALSAALASARIHGLTTNRDLLVNTLRHSAFLAGETHTAFFSTHGLDQLAAPLASDEAAWLSALAAALADAAARQDTARVLGGVAAGWGQLPSQLQRKEYERVSQPPAGSPPLVVSYRLDRAGLITGGRDDIALVSLTSGAVELAAGGVL